MFNGVLFQESLQDLVKGIRANRRNEEDYIRKRVADIGEECRTSDMQKKAVAVLKLTHLQMMGHSIAFSSFYIIEVMSCPDFASKRIGYLAAAQSFSPRTDVLLLTTNQFKKDLKNGKVQDCSQALGCLAKLVTEELARDLEQDVALLLTSPRAYIRKKAILVLYRLVLVHPDTLPVVSARFREMLADPDPGVVCAAVTVTCELARASPKNFLALAPILYQLLTNPASNNWMLIKIVKLMGVLTPLEPRLGKKLVEPLVTLMSTTRAKSLLYECCSTVTSGLLAHPEAVELCAKHLGEFMVDSDQNLKYLGLLSMRKLIKAHPSVAVEHRDLILDCLDDDDVGIRLRALEIVAEFVNKRNYRELCRILLRKLRKASHNPVGIMETADAEETLVEDVLDVERQDVSLNYAIDEEAPFREALAEQLLRPGTYIRNAGGNGTGGYELLTTQDDFVWYFVTILAGLANTKQLPYRISSIVADQMMELTSRVEAVRETSVKVSLSLFSVKEPSAPAEPVQALMKEEVDENCSFGKENAEPSALPGSVLDHAPIQERRPQQRSEDDCLPVSLVISASWIIGEYAELVPDHLDALRSLSSYRHACAGAVQAVFLTAVVKLYAFCPDEQSHTARSIALDYVRKRIDSESAEVQERAWMFSSILGDIKHADRAALCGLFEGKLRPVDARAQSKIPVPTGLDLEKPLVDTEGTSLCTYLLRQVSFVTDIDSVEDEDSNLFDNQAYLNSVQISGSRLSQNGDDVQSSSAKRNSLFYLSRESPSKSADHGPQMGDLLSGEHTQVDDAKLYSSHSDAVTAAVLVAEETPAGVDLSQPASSSEADLLRQRGTQMAVAFDEAFPSIPKKSKSKRSGKDKKKKKKKKSLAGSAVDRQPQETNLIDFLDAPAPLSSAAKPQASSTPKHLADDLLL